MKELAIGRSWAAALALLSVLVLAPSLGHTQIPQTINYQGSLSDSGGLPVNTPTDMTFKLYDAASGGTELWTETQTGVSVVNGVFNVTLGADGPARL